jgi:excisionase family DNA binding protein
MSSYLRVAVVAETLDVSPRTVLRWVERGELEAVRLPGGRLRISEVALAAFVANLAVRPIARRVNAAGSSRGGGE